VENKYVKNALLLLLLQLCNDVAHKRANFSDCHRFKKVFLYW